jgi:RNA polymerase sigma-70 factor (ECF subfamily)
VERTIDIEKIKRGDPVAFRYFFEYFYPKLMALACRFVDELTAKDLVQDVFASYWEKKHEIETENIRSYLYTWLRNNCLNHIKHQTVVEAYKARVRIAEIRISYLENITDLNDVLKNVMDRDLIEIIKSSAEKLPPKTARAFHLCYFQEKNHKEIAEEMQISVRTVEWHIRQAILFLRQDLKDLLMLIILFII